MVNLSRLIHTGQQLIDEPYVFSSQVKQVFYSKDPTDEDKMAKRRLRNLSIVQNPPNLEETNSEQQTAESSGTHRTRGCMLLKDLYELNFVERVKVARNSLGQPIGSEARLLAGYLGIIARNVNLFPINYESWHHMLDSNKNQALDNIKDRERVGTTSRQKQKFTHTAKSKSFACVDEDEEKLKDKRSEYEAIA
ncbi:hypothetical protein PVK06_040722 [Gossypium arboreum]|uniref:Uncharacterized protein n=1 Tax=Gossypium arboreum TaxID=29729 RepID=A0ABR0N6A2_GOSAR|nr:hypothetical protein PVK06_040722 [Gossypium arboreum]